MFARIKMESCNHDDFNVFYQLVDFYLEGISSITLKVNGNTYDNTYYLVDRIYQMYSSFVKTQVLQQNYFQRNRNHTARMLRNALKSYNLVGQ